MKDLNKLNPCESSAVGVVTIFRSFRPMYMCKFELGFYCVFYSVCL